MTAVTERPVARPETTSPGPTVSRQIRGELLKMWTTNLWWILGICALVTTGLALLVNGLIAHSQISEATHPPDFGAQLPPGVAGPSPEELARQEADWRAQHVLADVLVRSAASIFTSGQFFGLLIVMLFGAFMVTNEYYHQTATTTFLTAPRRTTVIISKLVGAAIIAAVAWAATTLIDLVVGAVFFSAEGQSSSLGVWAVQRAGLMNLVAYVLWALLGLGLGALLRNQIATILVGTGLYLIGGQIAQLVFIVVYSFWIKEAWVMESMVALPATASQVMISPERTQIWQTPTGDPIYAPQWWVGLLVLIGYGILAAGIGNLLIRRRDIN